MDLRNRKSQKSETQNGEEVQQGQNSTTNNVSTLQSLKTGIYYYVLWICNCVIQFIQDGIKCIIQGGIKLIIKALVYAVLALGFIYVVWNYVMKKLFILLICQSIFGYVPHISNYCTLLSESGSTNSIMVSLPVDPLVEKTVRLAEHLSETNVSMPIKLTIVKISLSDLKSSVIHSQIEENTKQKLSKQIGIIKDGIDETTSKIHTILATICGALTKMEIYTDSLTKHLTDETGVTNIQNQAEQHFQQYLVQIESQVNRVITNVESVQSILKNLEEEIDSLNVIADEAHSIDFKKLHDIKDASYMVTLYRITIGEGNVNKAKYERNIEVFKQFPAFTHSSLIIINKLNRLGEFKAAINEIKESTSNMDHAQALPMDLHIKILKDAMTLLNKYKQHLKRRIDQENIKN